MNLFIKEIIDESRKRINAQTSFHEYRSHDRHLQYSLPILHETTNKKSKGLHINASS